MKPEPAKGNSIVRASIEHLDELSRLFDLYRQFYRQTADAQGARSYLEARLRNDESIVFIALEEAGSGLGFTQLYPSFCSVQMVPIFVLYDLFVDPAGRRQGVGRALMNRAQEHALETGTRRLELSTAIDNSRAQALYESLGYERDTDFYHYSLAV